MAGHSRSKNGVASLAYVPVHRASLAGMPATSAGMTDGLVKPSDKRMRLTNN